MQRLLKRLSTLAVGLLALGGSGAAVAQNPVPGSNATVSATSFTVPSAPGEVQSEDESSACPGGQVATGGGIGTTGPAPSGTSAIYNLQLSGPLDGAGLTAGTDDGDVARHWYGAVTNSSQTAQMFKTFAICSRGSDATIEATAFDLGDFSSGAAIASCPAGKRVVGGGVGTTAPSPAGFKGPDYRVQLSGPLDETGLTDNTEDGDIARHWYAYVFNWSGAARTFKVFALCSRASDARVEATTFPLGDGSSGAAVATCPTGTRALGGGVGTRGPAPAGQGTLFYELQLSGPLDASGTTAATDDGSIARSWYGAIRNRSQDPDLFKVFALCTRESGLRCAGKRATIEGSPRGDNLRGTARDDVIVGLGGNDLIRGGDGNDVICGGSGNDRLGGGSGDDKLYGGPGNDRLSGGSGDDVERQ